MSHAPAKAVEPAPRPKPSWRPPPAAATRPPERRGAAALQPALGNAATSALARAQPPVAMPGPAPPRPAPPAGASNAAVAAAHRSPMVAGTVARNSIQTRLHVSSPTDPAELEAHATGKTIARMAEPVSARVVTPKSEAKIFRKGAPVIARKGQTAGPALQRKTDDAGMASPHVPAEISGAMSSGTPLPGPVRGFMESRFGADFSQVQTHTDDRAASLSRQLNARAFTVGRDIFFAKDQYKPDTQEGRELIAHELTHTIQQGAAVQSGVVHRSPEVHVAEHASPQAQREFWGIKSPREYFASLASAIPGFTLLTVVIGYNPITNARVDRSAGNILKGAIQLIPGGKFITDALNNHGVFDKVSNWAAAQFEALKDIGSAIVQEIGNLIKSISLDLVGLWNQAKGFVERQINRIKTFAIGLKDGIVGLIKDAILKPMAAFAQKTSGYPLLCMVMGKDPITGETVSADADALLGGFMKFIGEEEVFTNMQKAKAIPRAFAWFKNALKTLSGFVKEIPGLFVQAFKSLVIEDIILIPRAFLKLAGVFGGFAVRFVTWGANAVWNLLEIVFQSVAPKAWEYIQKTGAALKSILKNPLPFVGNLVKAAKMGLGNFADNIGTHLKTGLIEWLTGSLEGVYIPQAFSLPELGKFALSVLGITWAQIRGKIVKALGPSGEKIMAGLETTFDVIVALVKGGPSAAWEVIKDKLTGLKDMVVSGIIGFVTEAIVKKAIPKLIAMFIPGAGFISAILSIVDIVMVFVEKLAKIAATVKAFVDSIVAIAAGQIAGAAKKVESSLAGLLSLAISFLAGFLSLGKITSKIKEVIEKVRAVVDKGLDTAIAWIVGKAKALFGSLFGGKDGKPDSRTDAQKKEDLHKGVTEARTLLENRKLLSADIKKKLPAIQSKYGMTALELVSDAKSKSKEIDHIHGKINPEENSPTVEIDVGEFPKAVKEGSLLNVQGTSGLFKIVEIKDDRVIYEQDREYKKSGPLKFNTIRSAFIEDWNSGKISLGSVEETVEGRRKRLIEAFGEKVGMAVAKAIEKRGDIRKPFIVPDKTQIHHIIPIELLEETERLRLLVANEKWNFNGIINAIPLKEGFHSGHPNYTNYVRKAIAAWNSAHLANPIVDFKLWVEGPLILKIRTEIEAGRASGKTLDEYFKTISF